MTSEDIKAARLRLDESQAKFGKRLGVDQATIHRWETKGIPDRGAARHAVGALLKALRYKLASQDARQ